MSNLLWLNILYQSAIFVCLRHKTETEHTKAFFHAGKRGFEGFALDFDEMFTGVVSKVLKNCKKHCRIVDIINDLNDFTCYRCKLSVG